MADGTRPSQSSEGRSAAALWLRLWASVCLALYVAFWLELDNAFWAGTSAAIVCQPQLGASLRKGWFRMIGTVVGAIVIVVLTACFPQDRVAFLVALALWGAVCAFVATLLAQLRVLRGGAGRLHRRDHRQRQARRDRRRGVRRSSCSRSPAPARSASASCAPASFSPGPISAAPGAGWPRCSPIWRPRSRADLPPRWRWQGRSLPDTQPVRRELVRRVIALDPVIDEAIGESCRLRYHSPVLQTAVDGLFAALAGWRAVAAHLSRLPDGMARHEAEAVLRSVPQELRSAPEAGCAGTLDG